MLEHCEYVVKNAGLATLGCSICGYGWRTRAGKETGLWYPVTSLCHKSSLGQALESSWPPEDAQKGDSERTLIYSPHDYSSHMTRCTYCEALTPETSRYCTVCGTPMPGVVQASSELHVGGDSTRCRRCGAGNPKRSVFCLACGRYLKMMRDAAILLLLISSVVIVAVLSLALEKQWFSWLLVLFYVSAECAFGSYFFIFGPATNKHYLQWKARRRMKRELREGRF